MNGEWTDSQLVRTDWQGHARVLWLFGIEGEQTASARVDGLAPVQLRGQVVPVQGSIGAMLRELSYYLPAALASLQQGHATNPRWESQFSAKIALLTTPGIGGDILTTGRWAQGSMVSRSGATLPIDAVFPLESMRPEAEQSIHYTASVTPILEDFIGTPFPSSTIRIWHGFVIGMSGGGGAIYMEDRATYEERMRALATMQPYDAGIAHELAHSYVGNESLTQFLELYAFNVAQTRSTDLLAWRHTRGYVPGREGNDGVHALLDVYGLIGPEAMGRAYRAVVPLRPPYGQPLSAAAQQVFVDAAPAEARASVAAKMATIVF